MNRQLTKNFSYEELMCRHCGQCHMDPSFMQELQYLRDQWKRPITITSGYRCSEHNAAVGGAKGSKHLEGIAVDIAIHSANDRYSLLYLAMNTCGFTGIGIAKSFIHLDTRKGPAALWLY